MTVYDVQPGQTFRLDYIGHHGTLYAGNTFQMLSDGRVRATVDGRVWSLEDCGLSLSTKILGPVWGSQSIPIHLQ